MTSSSQTKAGRGNQVSTVQSESAENQFPRDEPQRQLKLPYQACIGTGGSGQGIVAGRHGGGPGVFPSRPVIEGSGNSISTNSHLEMAVETWFPNTPETQAIQSAWVSSLSVSKSWQSMSRAGVVGRVRACIPIKPNVEARFPPSSPYDRFSESANLSGTREGTTAYSTLQVEQRSCTQASQRGNNHV